MTPETISTIITLVVLLYCLYSLIKNWLHTKESKKILTDFYNIIDSASTHQDLKHILNLLNSASNNTLKMNITEDEFFHMSVESIKDQLKKAIKSYHK